AECSLLRRHFFRNWGRGIVNYDRLTELPTDKKSGHSSTHHSDGEYPPHFGPLPSCFDVLPPSAPSEAVPFRFVLRRSFISHWQLLTRSATSAGQKTFSVARQPSFLG